MIVFSVAGKLLWELLWIAAVYPLYLLISIVLFGYTGGGMTGSWYPMGMSALTYIHKRVWQGKEAV